MSLRHRGYVVEETDEQKQRLHSHRGFITDWHYPINGVEAGKLLRDGRAKLLKGNGGRIFLRVQGDKEYKVKAGLAKGISPKFWVEK